MSDYNVLAVGSKAGFYKGAEMMFTLNNPENAKLILEIMEMDSKGIVYSEKDSVLESGIQKVVNKIKEYESSESEHTEQIKVMKDVVNMIDPRFLSEEIVLGSKSEEKPILVALGENIWDAEQISEDLRSYGINAYASKDNDTVIEAFDISEEQLIRFLDAMGANYTIWEIPDKFEEEDLTQE